MTERAGGRTGDPFTANRFRWLDQVQDDPALNGSDFALAYAISRHLNRETNDAWPSVAQLGARHGSTERTVLTCLGKLRARGHLSIESGRGRHQVSHYRPILKGAENTKPVSPFLGEKMKEASPFPHGEKVKLGLKKGEEKGPKRRSQLPTELFEELSDELFERERTRATELNLSGDYPSQKRRRAGPKKLETPVPETWPTPEDIAWAEKECAAAGRHDLIARLPAIARYARNWCQDRGKTSADWRARWRMWFQREIDPPQGARAAGKSEQRSGQPRSGADAFEDIIGKPGL
jgi:hypothetical protein